MTITRRRFGQFSAGALFAGALAGAPKVSLAKNATGQKLHGISAFGELKYPADYSHFSYVNPGAPKGGTINFGVPSWMLNQNPQTFDTLNTFVLRGNAPPRIEHCFDSLMFAENGSASVGDEPSSIYGMIAETVEISEDRNRFIFALRPQARWHDDSPITSADVAFTFETLKDKGHPALALMLRNLEAVETPDPATAIVVFDGQQSDRTIFSVATIPIISKAHYQHNAFDETTLTPPLGSGPYRVGRFKAGSFIEYERVENYWAKDMPFNVGRNNFDVIRIEFYRERQAAFEAFKKGEITYREEFTSKTWATEYDFPAVQEGRVKQELFPAEKVPSYQGWAVNKRRGKFADARTVQAIALAFDFEWTNANIFFNAYERTQSFFEGSEFAAQGTPSDAELALLEPLRDQLDPAVFGEVLQHLPSDGSGRDRARLREASRLFQEAGWVRQGRSLVDEAGKPLSVEFLIRSQSAERLLAGFVANLKALGVDASIRLVDPAQYRKRLDEFDFDITGIARRYGATPSHDAMDQAFGSAHANRQGGTNLAGIADPAVDALLDKIRQVDSRDELTTVLRALDRVLRNTHSWIPNWHSANHRSAFWDMFGYPAQKPDYAFPVETLWWFDEEKAKAIGRG